MVKIELEGSNGEQLDINKSATLTVVIPSAISDNAPSSIPLWYFDETSGLWQEEGEATLNGDKYIGEVNHFTFWNCDVPSEFFTLLSGQISNAAGSPLVKVRITDLITNQSYTDWTDNAGNFDGYVPKDVALLLEVIENCGVNVIHSEMIGPFTMDETNIGQINISNSTDLVEITGVLSGCMGAPISNGQVGINFPDAAYPQVVNADTDGAFSTVITVCGATEIEIVAIDFDNQVFSDPEIHTVLPNIDLGILNVCGTSFTESVTFTVNGVTKILPGCTVSISTGGGQTAYQFNFEDATNAGELPVAFEWILYDSNNDLQNPNWTTNTNYTLPVVNNYIETYLNFGPDSGTLEVLQTATGPGDLLVLKFDNVIVSAGQFFGDGTITFTSYANCTVTFNAILQ